MTQELYSIEQVAQRLGLHARTVRNYVRDGRLKGTRIGKQYRIARADLEELTGAPVAAPLRETTPRRRHAEVSSIVQIDAVSADDVYRVTTMLMASTAGPRDGDQPLRIETVYDEERARLKIVVLGGVASSAELIRLIGVLIEADR